MATKKIKRRKAIRVARDLMKIGDRVRILHYGGQVGEIVEFRGPLGPGGARIYGVVIRRKPRRDYLELREDQLELVEVAPSST